MKRKFPKAEAATKALANSHPALKRLIKRVGAPALYFHPRRSVFESLARSIVFQQLHGRAAETILQRFMAQFPPPFPSPESVAKARIEKLMRAGLSRAKAMAIQDLARKVLQGSVPSRAKTARMTNEEIIKALTEVRGIGRWTVEMFLIFTLGRVDVLPAHDFGVRKGYSIVFRKPEMLTPKQLEKQGERWSPYRSILSWYLWRAAELK